jgi:transcriptional regulator NrdR family protein
MASGKTRYIPIVLTADGRPAVATISKSFDAIGARARRVIADINKGFAGMSSGMAKQAEHIMRQMSGVGARSGSSRMMDAHIREYRLLEKEAARSSREVQRIERETARQANAQARVRERAAKQLADVQTREAKRGATAFLGSMKEMNTGAANTARSSSSVFERYLSGAFFATLAMRAVSAFYNKASEFVTKGVQLAADFQNALKGLRAEAAFRGFSDEDATNAVKNLRLVRGGVISVADASTALKNLLQSKFSLPQAVEIMERFSDAAAFGKQQALDYGDAIRGAAEGIKNSNSRMVDNVGLTKNLSVIMRERGFQLEDLDSKTKGLAAREALYQGILSETTSQLGNADKLMEGYSGRVASLDMAEQNLQRSLGDIVINSPAYLEAVRLQTEQVNGYTDALKDSGSETVRFARRAVAGWSQIKAITIPVSAMMIQFVGLVALNVKTMVQGALGGIVYMVEEAYTIARNAATAIPNLLIDSINKIHSVADGLGITQKLEELTGIKLRQFEPFQTERADFGGDGLLKGFVESARSMEEIVKSIRKLDNEAYDASRSVVEAFNRGEERRGDSEIKRALRDAEGVRRVEQARALAGEQGGGGAGEKAKKVKAEFTGDQLRFAREIVETGLGLGANERQVLAALAAALVESNLRNVAPGKGDRDSVGIFQQRPSQGWGNAATLLNVGEAASRFYRGAGTNNGALDVAQGGTVGQLAQRVQRSAFPGRYDKRLPQARRLFDLAIGEGVSDKTLEAAKKAQHDQIVKRSMEANANAPLATGGGTLAGTVTKNLTTYEAARKAADDQFGEQIQALYDRRMNLDKEVADQSRRALIERQNREMDYVVQIGSAEATLHQMRVEQSNGESVLNRRTAMAKNEQVDLTQRLINLEDDYATASANTGLRAQVAAAEEMVAMRRADVEAVESQVRSQVRLADATNVHGEQVRAKVLEHLASQKTATEAWADTITGAYDQVTSLIDSRLDKITGKLSFLNEMLKTLVHQLLNAAFKGLLNALSPAGKAGAGGASSGGGFSLGKLLGIGGGSSSGGGGGTPPFVSNLTGGGGGSGGGIINTFRQGGIKAGLKRLFGFGSSAATGAGSAAAGSAAAGIGSSAAATGGVFTGSLFGGVGAGAGIGAGVGAGAGGGGAAAGGAAAGGGSMLGSMGALFSNPWTAVVAGAALGAFALWKHFSHRTEKALRKEIKSAYQVDVREMSALKEIKALGEQVYGKGQVGKHLQETVRLDAVKEMISSYAERTGQTASSLIANKQLADAGDPRNNFAARMFGGPVTRGMPYIVGERRAEMFVPRESGHIEPRVNDDLLRGLAERMPLRYQRRKMLDRLRRNAASSSELSPSGDGGGGAQRRSDVSPALVAAMVGAVQQSNEIIGELRSKLRSMSPKDVLSVAAADAPEVIGRANAESLKSGSVRQAQQEGLGMRR